MRKSEKFNLIRKKREENEQLENETKALEQRLRLLRSTLYDKQSSSHSNKNSRELLWTSSKPKLHSGTAKLGSIDLTKTQLRTLKRSEESDLSGISNEKNYGQLIKKLLSNAPRVYDLQPIQLNEHNSVPCGQCESKTAVVSCQECSEDYCARCFAQFHMKGALKRHHSIPISSKSSPKINQMTNGTISCKESANVESSLPKSNHIIEEACQTDSGCTSSKAQTSMNETGMVPLKREVETGTQYNSTQPGFIPEIHFTSALTYAEKLLLRIHRKQQVIENSEGDNECTINEKGVLDYQDQATTLQTLDFKELYRIATAEFSDNDVQPLLIRDAWVNMKKNALVDPVTQNAVDFNRDYHQIQQANCDDLRITSPTERETTSQQGRNTVDPSSFSATSLPECPKDAAVQPNNANENELRTINMIRRHLNLLTSPTEYDPLGKPGD